MENAKAIKVDERTLDLDLYRGATFTMRMSFENGAEAGDRIRMMVRQSLDGEAVITKDLTLGADMAVTLTFESADTQELDPGRYIYDIDLVRGSESVPLIQKSKLKIRGDVTHD